MYILVQNFNKNILLYPFHNSYCDM